MRRNSGIIGPKQVIAVDDNSTTKISDLYDQHTYSLDKRWPNPLVLNTNTVSSTTITEGDSVTFTIDSNYHSTGNIYWTMNYNGSSSAADFVSAASGVVAIGSSPSTIVIETALDSNAESTETFYLDYRTGSTSGPIIASSPIVSIANLAINITTQFIAAQPATTFSYSSSSDSTANYDIEDFTVPANASGSKRIYIGCKCTHPTSYRNDITVAGLQILNSAGNAIQRADIFSASTEGYQTVTSRIRNSTAIGFAPISTATGASYFNMYSSSGYARRWNRATGTSSTYTGMADGISTAYNTSTILPAPSNTSILRVPQSSGTFYHYVETSGASRYDEYVMRSPAYTFSGGEIIRLCFQLPSGFGTFDIDNSIFLAIA